MPPRDTALGGKVWMTGLEDRSTGNTESLIVTSEIRERFPPPSQSLTVYRIKEKKLLAREPILFCCSTRFAKEIIPQKRGFTPFLKLNKISSQKHLT